MAKYKNLYNSSKKKKNNKNNEKNKSKINLEDTIRIRTDDIRLNDADTLDTSFLEGRIDKKIKKNKIRKENILNSAGKKKLNLKPFRFIFFGISFLLIFVFLIIIIMNNSFFETKSNKFDKNIEDVSIKIDNNYLFVGDYSINRINFDNYDYHYVKSSDDDMTTIDLVNNLHDRIYKYNPSHIFICIGINDLNDDKSIEEIIDNISKIISGIKDNRPVAKIYIESLYPINKDVDDYDSDILSKDVDNDKIVSLNERIKDLTIEKKVNYIDMYSLLVDNDKLDSNYTDNGIYLNKKGNEVVKKKINEIIG